MLETIFWLSVAGVVYPYLGYPLVLALLSAMTKKRRAGPIASDLPSVTMIIPVHNEASRIERKIANSAALDYPPVLLEILFVSDGSTDRTVERITACRAPNMEVIELPARRGKAAALNAGLRRARHDVLVFSDASIELEPGSLRRLVQQFQDPAIGCISGEDRIGDGGGEGLYGRYELLLRRLETQVHSIVGASGSFYAQRRSLCAPFDEGLAPDFLSVLRTVHQGFRAVSESTAVGSMTSLKDPRQEFTRKVRTLLRGMTTLFAMPELLNPFRFGRFSFALWSHKVLRWTVPFLLVIALLSAVLLVASPWYAAAFVAQVLFYAAALVAFAEIGGFQRSLPGKVALYFTSANMAILSAWLQYGRGVRQEVWAPSRRDGQP